MRPAMQAVPPMGDAAQQAPFEFLQSSMLAVVPGAAICGQRLRPNATRRSAVVAPLELDDEVEDGPVERR